MKTHKGTTQYGEGRYVGKVLLLSKHQALGLNTLTGRNLTIDRHAIDALCTEQTAKHCKHT